MPATAADLERRIDALERTVAALQEGLRLAMEYANLTPSRPALSHHRRHLGVVASQGGTNWGRKPGSAA